jgi:glycosyltransferase involved in cell wall biosynthesis
MTFTKKDKQPRVIMFLGALPPMAVGGAELQAIKLSKQLIDECLDVKIITWGKLGQKRKGTIEGIVFYRIVSFLNIFIDVPALFKRKTAQVPQITKIEYNDAVDRPDEMTDKVRTAMILRYHVFFWSALWFLWWRRKKFDIIHVHMMEWPAWVCVKLGKILNKPVLIKDSTMNGISNILRYPSGNEKQQLIVQHAYCVAMTHVIGQNLLKAGLQPSRLFYIPNGIEVDTTPVSKKTWDNKVIFIGNLRQQPAKGIDILLKAWQQVVKVIPAARLQIVGDGDLKAYKSYTERLDILEFVDFLGKQNNVKAILGQSDLFVLPSRREGMSNALMEAMLCGLPVVATDISGNQDLVQNGLSGILVPPANVNAISRALIYALQHPNESRKMGKNAYYRVVEMCNLEKVARQYKNVYQTLVK